MVMSSLALVDDHPIIIEGLMRVLGSQGDFDIVATGKSSQDALTIAEKYYPKLMIFDLSLREDAVATIKLMRSKHPSTSIIVFTAERGVEHAVKALEAGARGYVSKCSPIDELLRAARAAISGETYISRNLASRLVGALRAASARTITLQALKLSVREEQIIGLLIDGKTNREIASYLGITERTVKHYMTILMQKLCARNRVEVVIAAQNLDCHTHSSSPSIAGVFSSEGQWRLSEGRSCHS